ncbi:MAG: iron dependent repressor, metal binding and dimerization domain protein [Aminipila sp.]
MVTAILNRHETLASIFLSIGVPKDIASKDACKIEHVIKEITLYKIK